MRYAQINGGRQLHLVDEINGEVARRALCGFTASKGWRMTINVPLGHACKNCIRIYNAQNPTPREYVLR